MGAIKGRASGGAVLSDQPAAGRRHPGKAPAAIGVVSPAPHVRRRSVARLSEHTGGLGAPQAVGLEAPPRVVIHSGGERIGMRDGGESRTLPRRSDPHPPTFTVWFLNSEDRLRLIIIYFTF